MTESKPEASSVAFNTLPNEDAARSGGTVSWDVLSRLELPVQVELGRVELTMRDLLDLTPGSILEIDKAVGEPVHVFVSGKLIAHGEVVVVLGDRLGVRILELVDPA